MRRALSFRGRTSRTEYGKVFATIFVAAFVLKGVSLTPIGESPIKVLAPGLLVPMMGASIRRLHDTDRSGHTMWLSFIPLVGSILLLMKLFEPGSEGLNHYGPPPPRPDGEPTAPTPLHRRTYLDAEGKVLRYEVVDAAGNVVQQNPPPGE